MFSILKQTLVEYEYKNVKNILVGSVNIVNDICLVCCYFCYFNVNYFDKRVWSLMTVVLIEHIKQTTSRTKGLGETSSKSNSSMPVCPSTPYNSGTTRTTKGVKVSFRRSRRSFSNGT